LFGKRGSGPKRKLKSFPFEFLEPSNIFGIDMGVLIFPLTLQEMVMAVELIVEGLNNLAEIIKE